MDSRHVFSVSELNAKIRSLLEDEYPFINVSGEISNLHRPHSGHLYFTLKDGVAQIRAVLFKMQQRYLNVQPKDGMQVLCRGRISVYELRGEYQFILDTLEPYGEGALRQAVEQLKTRLAAEGLFGEQLKRPLPKMPGHITLITSPRGAAVHDFIQIATRRYPPVHLAVYPVSVQGPQAADEIIQALAKINASLPTEVIVLCRGGGSLEDLMAFNDEKLARAIRASALPVVSAVGHEIDFTIADLAADLRAPTPSAAAELLLPDRDELLFRLKALRLRLRRAVRANLDRDAQRLRLAAHTLKSFSDLPDQQMLRLDRARLGLELAIRNLLAKNQHRVDIFNLSLAQNNAAHLPTLHQQRLFALRSRLNAAMRSILLAKEECLRHQVGVLQAVSPLATLARGYAIVRRREKGGKNMVITDAAQVRHNEAVELILHRGRLVCRVEAREETSDPGNPAA